MKKLMSVIVLGVCALLGGCSTAGPFVTNISSDGRGNLIVEKNTVHFNPFIGYVYLGNAPSSSSIKIIPEDRLERK